MKEFMEGLSVWWPLILIVGQLLLGWGNWKLSRRFATKKELQGVCEEVEAQDKKIIGMGSRVSVLESELRHLPTSSDLCKLREAISGIEATHKGLSNNVELFNEYLINQSKKG